MHLQESDLYMVKLKTTARERVFLLSYLGENKLVKKLIKKAKEFDGAELYTFSPEDRFEYACNAVCFEMDLEQFLDKHNNALVNEFENEIKKRSQDVLNKEYIRIRGRAWLRKKLFKSDDVLIEQLSSEYGATPEQIKYAQSVFISKKR